MKLSTRALTRAGMVAALYAVLSLIPVYNLFGFQVRPAEALTVLPILMPEAVWGLFVGCVIANSFVGAGMMIDIVFGSLTTLLAAYLTWRFRRTWLAYVFPIAANAVFVSLYLHIYAKIPYWVLAGQIAVSEAAVVLLLGIPLIIYLKRSHFFEP